MPAGIQPIDEKKKAGLLEAISTAGNVLGTAASIYEGGSKLLDKFAAPAAEIAATAAPQALAEANPLGMNEAFVRRQKSLLNWANK